MAVGDLMCMMCGGKPAAIDGGAAATEAPSPDNGGQPVKSTVVDGWTLLRKLPSQLVEAPFETFVATSHGREVLLTLYRQGFEPDPGVQAILQRMNVDHSPAMLAVGRYEDRAYEVTEQITGGTLRELGFPGATDPLPLAGKIVDEIGRALESFSELGLRHRDLNPSTIHVRTRVPLDLVIAGFGSAQLSDFDLEAVAPLELTRYSAPEAIVGAVSAASDWWSLGVIILEQATVGRC